MMKKEYAKLEMEVIEFKTEDIIITSNDLPPVVDPDE